MEEDQTREPLVQMSTLSSCPSRFKLHQKYDEKELHDYPIHYNSSKGEMKIVKRGIWVKVDNASRQNACFDVYISTNFTCTFAAVWNEDI